MSETSVDYRPMWQELGLNLENHDALLEVLGKMYDDMFLTQPNRPAGMKYLDFVMSEVHGLRIKELVDARAEGRKVVGTYCTFVPEELILAVDGICVGLCAGADFAVEEVEKYLPRNTCSLIKSTFGFKLGGVCPYLEASDLVVGENTCDGKKKAYEIFDTIINKMYVMDLPQVKNELGRVLMRAEYIKFKEKMEAISGKEINLDALQNAIEIANNKRKALHRLQNLRINDPAPISGLDSLLINQVSFYDDPVRFTDSVNKICDELEERVSIGKGVAPHGTARLLVSGCPMAIPNWKVPKIVEASNAVIVCEESCIGERGIRNLVANEATTVDGLIDALVDRYMDIDCAIYTPNPDRLNHIKKMYRKYNADGVILYGLNFCTPYLVEAVTVEKKLQKEEIPVLKIETDYSQEDTEQIMTRIETFIEIINNTDKQSPNVESDIIHNKI